MAKRKKKSAGAVENASPSVGGGRHSVDITDAQNGYIVNVSGETGGKDSKYYSKRFISPTHEGALGIVSSHLAGGKKGKKKGGRKRIAAKKG